MENLDGRSFNGTAKAEASLTVALMLTSTGVGLLSILWGLLVNCGALGLLAESLTFYFSCRLAKGRGVQAVHECLAALLLADLVNVIAAVFFAAQVAAGSCGGTCVRAFGLWFLSRSFMEGLHLLCSMECVLFLRSPQAGTRLQLAATCIAVFLVSILPFYVYHSQVAVTGESGVNCGMALVIIVAACRKSAVPGKRPVVAVAMVTFFFFYLPKFLFQCLLGPFRYRAPLEGGISVYEKFLFFTNFQLVLDGILCFFILKLPVEERQGDDNPIG